MGDFYGTGIEIWAGYGAKANFPAFIASKSFDPSNTSNEMIDFVAHFDVSKKYEIVKALFNRLKHFQLCLAS